MMEKVIVTGAAGYIGQVLCQRLREEGYYVIGVDKSSYRHASSMEFSSEHIDNCDQLLTDISTVPAFGPQIQTIFHLAATSVPIEMSVSHPLRYYDNNVGVTTALLNKLIWQKWKGNIVFASSAAVYTPSFVGINECTNEMAPPTHYGRSKLMCEQILDAATVNGIRTIAFRFFNVAGAYKHLGDSNPHVLTKMFGCVHKDPNFFTINGNDFRTEDGTAVRDYVHVLDVCNAMIAAARQMMVERMTGHYKARGFYDVYNLGSGDGTSLLDLKSMVEHVVQYKVAHRFGPRREADIDVLVADPSKFIREYDFVFKNSSLTNVVKTAWEHYALRRTRGS